MKQIANIYGWLKRQDKELRDKLQDLKGAVSRDFQPLFFFHESNPSGPLINRLKWFFLKIRFREDIRI